MSDFDLCLRCKDYHFLDRKCAPKWEVNIAEYDGEDDWRTIHAIDEEDAAEKTAERFDQGGDYSVVGGSDVTVRVRKDEDSPVKTFRVSGETVPRYSATEID